MAFRNDRLPDQIRAARQAESSSLNSAPTFTSAGVAQKAKLTASRWAKANIDNPRDDSAAAWFVGRQPFSELRMASGDAFGAWKDRFIRETDMGYNFAPPPEPEPEPKSAPSVSGQSEVV